jgi:acetyl esterase
MRFADRVQRAAVRRVFQLPPRILELIAGRRVTSPEGYVLGPHERILLHASEAIGRRELADVGVMHARSEMDREAKIVDFGRPNGAPRSLRVTDDRIDLDTGALPVRIYEPDAARPTPVLVYFHGGGWVVGSIESHDGVCAELARLAGVVVVSVAYRLAPEAPYPEPVDDAVAATRWAIRAAASRGWDARAVAVGGDSAGGNLAAVVSQEMRGDTARPAFQLLVYPATDLTRSLPSHRHFATGFMLTEKSIDFYLAHYIRENQLREPRASPLFATNMRDLPPSIVLTAGFDPLRDEGRAYADAMRAAGNDVEYLCLEQSIHGFFSMGGVMPHARDAVSVAATALRSALRRK